MPQMRRARRPGHLHEGASKGKGGSGSTDKAGQLIVREQQRRDEQTPCTTALKPRYTAARTRTFVTVVCRDTLLPLMAFSEGELAVASMLGAACRVQEHVRCTQVLDALVDHPAAGTGDDGSDRGLQCQWHQWMQRHGATMQVIACSDESGCDALPVEECVSSASATGPDRQSLNAEVITGTAASRQKTHHTRQLEAAA